MSYKSYAPSIAKDELRLLPTIQFQGKIHLIDEIQDVKEACDLLQNEPLLGFDTETKPSFRKGRNNTVSLLQLSSESDAFLFRLNKIGFPEMLSDILTNSQIIKVGIAIRDDIRLLRQIHSFNAEGFIELQQFVREFGIENSGLSRLAGIVLQSRISKSQQLSNWENETLTESQQLYAATDAWAAFEIYKTLTIDN